ncbi:tRNA lysidine(34) synthetase TilS, partial [Candidatus Dependentiae bacterium]|nr:tRNA lysidine(34) synthetase TilS [Candidatus Dependentiae bacterium]
MILYNRILDKLKKLNVDFEKKVLVALSGGADSVFLAESISEIFEKNRVVCCHINHNLRQNASNDENFVSEYCKNRNLELVIKKIDVRKYSEDNKISIETAGRDLRYMEFEKVIEEKKIEYLFTAHTADDNIETFFMRLLRGTGLQGLECIKEITFKKTHILIRPM